MEVCCVGLAALIQIMLSVVFALSAVTKLFSRASFMETLQHLWFREGWDRMASWVVPLVELLLALLLLYEPLRLAAEIGILVLLVCFAAVTWWVMAKHVKVQCHCFGSLVEDSFSWSHVTKIALLMILNIFLLMHRDSTGLEFASNFEIVGAILFTGGVVSVYIFATNLFHHQVTNEKGVM